MFDFLRRLLFHVLFFSSLAEPPLLSSLILWIRKVATHHLNAPPAKNDIARYNARRA
jgi:hypothetical protein